MEIKTIETERLILRKPNIDDCNTFYSYLLRPEMTEFSQERGYQTFESFYVSFSSNILGNLARHPFWTICLKDTNKVIGSIALEMYKPRHKTCQIGYEINPDFFNNGYATEALIALMEYLEQEDMHRIEISIWQGNVPSIKVAKKAGFKLESIAKQCRYKNDKFYDILNYVKIFNFVHYPKEEKIQN